MISRPLGGKQTGFGPCRFTCALNLHKLCGHAIVRSPCLLLRSLALRSKGSFLTRTSRTSSGICTQVLYEKAEPCNMSPFPVSMLTQGRCNPDQPGGVLLCLFARHNSAPSLLSTANPAVGQRKTHPIRKCAHHLERFVGCVIGFF